MCVAHCYFAFCFALQPTSLSSNILYAGLVRLHGWGTPKDLPGAMQYFEKASRGGNLLASYNLAVLYLMGTGSGVANLCESAVALLKKVSERGWASVNEASNDFENGDYGWSLYNYLKLAEIGVELAQNNAAWMLQHMYGYHGYRADDLATYMYKISAAQGNHDALVPLGDAYWYGKGIDVDLRKAGSLYTAASKINHPRALFNLGYMHQYGLGMPKDMHIAKRYYDQAMMTGTGAYLPSVLALTWLQVHNSWDAVLKPMVPKYLASFINPIFESDGLETPRATAFAKAVNALYAPFKGIVSLGNYVEAIEDAMDSTLFLWIVAFAGLVVWKMRMNRRPGIVTGQHRPTENIPDEQGNDEMAT
jgi:TPR repeat protein